MNAAQFLNNRGQFDLFNKGETYKNIAHFTTGI